MTRFPPSAGPPRRAAGLAAAFVTVLLLAATLAPFHPGPQERVPWTCVACTPEGTADFVANVAAFVPLGAALAAAGWRGRMATAAGVTLSTAIELLQGLGIAGRTPVLGDVLANGLGSWAGAALVTAGPMLWAPTPRVARRVAAAGTLGWAGLMAASGWLLARDAAPGPRPPQPGALPSVPGFGWFAGRVTSLTIDAAHVPSPPSGPAVVAVALGPAAAVALAVQGGDARGAFVPALAIVDAARRPALALGMRGAAAELRVRTRARRWRLREAPLVVPGALALLASGDRLARATLDVSLAPGRVALAVEAATGSRRTLAGKSWVARPAHGWTLVVPVARPWGPEAGLLDALWVGTLLVPVGVALRRATPAVSALVAAGGAALVAGLVGAPALVGAPGASAVDWVAGAAALALGMALAGARLPAPPGPASLRA